MRPLASIVSLLVLASSSAAGADFSAEVVRELNLARTDPARYADIVEGRMRGYCGREGDRAVREAVRFLRRARPLAPLAVSEGLEACALLHVERQGPTGRTGHRGPRGTRPVDRLAKYGEWIECFGENIHYGRVDPRGVVVALIVDDGVRGRGHRKNIFASQFCVVGVANGRHARYGRMCVINFAGGFEAAGSENTNRPDKRWSLALGMLAR